VAIKLIIIISITLITAVLSVRSLCNPKSWLYIADVPNDRSLHVIPTPRNGGLGLLAAILAGWLAAWAFGYFENTQVFIGIIMFGLAMLGYLDDRFDLRSSIRFAGHFAAAGFAVFVLGPIESIELPGILEIQLGVASIPFSLIFIVWMINLYNFMDGMDGFAGGMTLFGFTTLAVICAIQNNIALAVGIGVPAAAAMGFLLYNFPPAKIFLGDAGSTALGFLSATAMLFTAKENSIPLWVSIMIFSPFIIDATITLLTRMLRKERFWAAHRTHYYQRLVTSGNSHKKVVLCEYLLMFTVSIFGITAVCSTQSHLVLFIVWLLIFSFAAFSVNRLTASAFEKSP
jgi:UDP-N-acetylmuramyl pentapeptide phosphotransferase/UDP-N-acetylglucosamine-1-phosphate transferase